MAKKRATKAKKKQVAKASKIAAKAKKPVAKANKSVAKPKSKKSAPKAKKPVAKARKSAAKAGVKPSTPKASKPAPKSKRKGSSKKLPTARMLPTAPSAMQLVSASKQAADRIAALDEHSRLLFICIACERLHPHFDDYARHYADVEQDKQWRKARVFVRGALDELWRAARGRVIDRKLAQRMYDEIVPFVPDDEADLWGGWMLSLAQEAIALIGEGLQAVATTTYGQALGASAAYWTLPAEPPKVVTASDRTEPFLHAMGPSVLLYNELRALETCVQDIEQLEAGPERLGAGPQREAQIDAIIRRYVWPGVSCLGIATSATVPILGQTFKAQ